MEEESGDYGSLEVDKPPGTSGRHQLLIFQRKQTEVSLFGLMNLLINKLIATLEVTGTKQKFKNN